MSRANRSTYRLFLKWGSGPIPRLPARGYGRTQRIKVSPRDSIETASRLCLIAIAHGLHPHLTRKQYHAGVREALRGAIAYYVEEDDDQAAEFVLNEIERLDRELS